MPYLWLILYIIAYAAVHSLLASQFCKTWAQRIWGSTSTRWYRLLYNIIAGLTLVPLLSLLWLQPDILLYSVSSPWRWLMFGGQIAVGIGFVLALFETRMDYFMGTAQLRDDPTSSSDADTLVTSGSYAYVRHPLYSLGLLWMWLSPVMTLNTLILYSLFSVYLYLGSFHEEQRLVKQFGPAYQHYQQCVGRFIPRLKRCPDYSSQQTDSS
jgi:protein-S-isoprenylcysteine O-methyltransferase Ste14